MTAPDTPPVVAEPLPLPEPVRIRDAKSDRDWYVYTGVQMRAHEAAAVAAERERCAQVCEKRAWTHPNTAMLGPEQNALKCAAAIRAQPQSAPCTPTTASSAPSPASTSQPDR